METKNSTKKNEQVAVAQVISSRNIHELKTINPYFDDVFYNRKNFEVRKNDRDYKVGDRLKLIEHDSNVARPRYVLKDIQYILPGGQYGIDPEYVVLGLKETFPISFPLSESFVKSVQEVKKAVENMQNVRPAQCFGRGCGCVYERYATTNMNYKLNICVSLIYAVNSSLLWQK